MIAWLAPALGFLVIHALIGITAKLALRDVEWRQLVFWAAVAYALIAAWMIAVQGVGLTLEPGAAWGVAAGLCAVGGLCVLMVALHRGEVSRVVPVTAAYPVVSVALAALVLAEQVTVQRLLGTALVIIGVVVLGREQR